MNRGRSLTDNPIVNLLAWIMIMLLWVFGIVMVGAVSKIIAFFFMAGWNWVTFL